MRLVKGSPHLTWSEVWEIFRITNRAVGRDGFQLFPFRMPQLTRDEKAMVTSILAVAAYREQEGSRG